MYLSAAESRTLSRVFGLLAENLAEHEVRQRIGYGLLDLLRADYFASFVWDEGLQCFGSPVSINMSQDALATYDRYYQFHDPITFKLQARHVPTLVTQVMPQRDLIRTEFFNDFLARDGLHWGVNLYSYAGPQNIGDLRIWRNKTRDNFDAHTLDLLRLIEPAFTGALLRTRPVGPVGNAEPSPSSLAADQAFQQDFEVHRSLGLSPRELEVARMASQGMSDKEIAARLMVELSTVRTYMKRTFDKLGVHRRTGVAAVLGRIRQGN